ncbi:MAG: hypothetical protein K8T10_10505 [Candidatus Eremiobacteraeota bacterium]|nr:hypothetical protein [Candidatus Eremiobacteraeota bacterium]
MRQYFLQLKYSKTKIRKIGKKISRRLIAESKYLTEPNFEQISRKDVAGMFWLYDEIFFNNFFKNNFENKIGFRLSNRMTRIGGKTTMRMARGKISYEICLSSELLFQTFDDVKRKVEVNGIVCFNRLEAAMRIMEHEIIHLLEMVLFGDSSCSAPRFKGIVKNIFGHTDVTHKLVTQRERAFKKLGLKVGDRVRFSYDEKYLKGIIYRITKRATVMVQDGKGTYIDKKGNRYSKYYIPLELLSPAVPSCG